MPDDLDATVEQLGADIARDLEIAYQRGRADKAAEPWHDLKRRTLGALNGANLILVLLLMVCLVVPALAYLISLVT